MGGVYGEREPEPGSLRSQGVGGSVWAARVEDLLRRTASAEPTPGGGSVAAVTGALGVALIQMAVAVTERGAVLDHHGARLASLQEQIMPAADADMRHFDAVMAAYRLPRDDNAQRGARLQKIEKASIDATDGPLSLVAVLVEALALSREVEPLVKASIVSDVLAGREVIGGAARAALLTADINIDALTRRSAPAAAELRVRRDTLVAAVQDAS